MDKKAKFTLLGIGAAVALTFAAFMIPKNSSVGASDLSKEEVQEIVREFITQNPQVIMDSLNKFHQEQQAQQQQQQSEGAKLVKDDIAKDKHTPMAGNAKGDVTVVEFFDYNCGFCKRMLPTVQQLISEDKKVRVLFKELPILSPDSETASRYALAVHELDKGKYFDYHSKLMQSPGHNTEEALQQFAADLGLDKEKVKEKANSTEVRDHLNQNRQMAEKIGVRGTPGFIVGEQIIPGAVDIATLKAAVEKARSN